MAKEAKEDKGSKEAKEDKGSKLPAGFGRIRRVKIKPGQTYWGVLLGFRPTKITPMGGLVDKKTGEIREKIVMALAIFRPIREWVERGVEHDEIMCSASILGGLAAVEPGDDCEIGLTNTGEEEPVEGGGSCKLYDIHLPIKVIQGRQIWKEPVDQLMMSLAQMQPHHQLTSGVRPGLQPGQTVNASATKQS